MSCGCCSCECDDWGDRDIDESTPRVWTEEEQAAHRAAAEAFEKTPYGAIVMAFNRQIWGVDTVKDLAERPSLGDILGLGDFLPPTEEPDGDGTVPEVRPAGDDSGS